MAVCVGEGSIEAYFVARQAPQRPVGWGSIRAFRFRKIALLKNAAEQKTFLLLLFFLGKKRRSLKSKIHHEGHKE
jgi:hypothetical protein